MVKIQRRGPSLTEAFVPSSSQEGPNSGWDWLDEAQGTSPIGWVRLARLLERAESAAGKLCFFSLWIFIKSFCLISSVPGSSKTLSK